MKRWQWVVIGSLGLVLVLATGAILALNVGSVHRQIEERVGAAAGFDVRLGTFHPAFPFRLGVGGSTVKNEAMTIEWDDLSVSVSRLIPPFGIDVKVTRPRVTMNPPPPGVTPPPEPAKPPVTTDPDAKGGPGFVPPLKLSLHVIDGVVRAPAGEVSKLNIRFDQASLMRTPASVVIDAWAKAGPLPAPLPLHLETDSLTFTPEVVAATEVNARVAGVAAKVGGASDLSKDLHEWTLALDAPDLKSVPLPGPQVTVWSGAVTGQFKIKKDKLAIDADGALNVAGVSATLNVSEMGAKVAGPLAADVDLSFGYHGAKLNLPKAHAVVNLSGAAVTYGDLFKKAASVPLYLAVDAAGDGSSVKLARADVRLAEVRANAAGTIGAVKPFAANIKLAVPAFDLATLIPIVPPLAQLPTGGKVAFAGTVTGPLGTPELVNLDIERASLQGPVGSLSARGRVAEVKSPKGPRLKLDVAADPLLLGGVRAALPAFKDLLPAGEVRAKISLSGLVTMNKPWPEWPLDVGGDVNVRIPEYTLVSAPPAPKTLKGATTTPEPRAPAAEAGFLPKGYLPEHLNIKVAADVAKVLYQKLVIAQIAARGQIAKAHFRGDATVGQIFKGQARASGIDVPLTDVKPVIAGEVGWTGLVIEDAIGFAKPEFKDFANGKTTGKAKFSTRMPGTPEFTNALEASGELAADPVTLNGLKLGEIINQSLGKLPGIKIPPVKMAPLQGQVTGAFSLAKGVAEVPRLTARDLDHSELNMKGRVRLADLNGDFTGTFAWANSPIRGCMAEGNSDASGRVLIPVLVKGDLMKPGVSLIGDTLSKLGAKALECEGKKLIDRAKKDGLDGLKNEAGKVLKGLFGN